MHQFSRSNKLVDVNYHLPVFTSVAVIGYLSSFIFFAEIWADQNYFLHSAIGILSISLPLFTFINVWNAYSETNYFVQWVGLVSLTMVLLNLPHVVNFADFINMPEMLAGFLMDISLKYGVLIAYLEISIWLLLGFFRKGCTVNKWLGLVLSLSIAVFFLAILVKLLNYLPDFYSGFSITIVKRYADFVLSFIAIVVLAVYVVKFKNTIDDREKVIDEYIILALCFFIPARIIFALSRDITSPMQFLGHIFKLAYYYSIYYGVYKATIGYPYSQLRKVKDFYEKLLDTSPIGIITFGEDGKVSYASRQCDSLFRYDMRKIYGITTEQFLDSVVIYDSSKSELLEKLQNFRGGAVTFYGLPFFTQDSSSKLIFNIHSLETGIVFAVRDAKKEQAIENMQLQTQTLLDSTDNVVFLIDINRKVVMCNKKFLEITNMKTSDLVGLDVMEMPRLFQSNLKDVTHINADGEEMMRDTKWSIRTAEGNTIKISLDSSSIYDVDNEKIGWIIIGRDISEYEKEQEKIIHSEKMAIIGQMAAGLVHEIKNPLASIKGLCQLMARRVKPEKITEYASVMERAVDDINEIVTGFLQFSKPASGEFAEEGINSLVNSLELLISTNGYKHGIKTYFYYSNTEEPVIMSSQQIKNAILGMVDNALDAMHSAIDPKLIISTEHDKSNNMMSVSVKDNGIGMTEEQLACIGTPFYTTKPGGTGLGVSVIKYIVNEHGGTLKVESKFGEGAVFTIILPCKVTN